MQEHESSIRKVFVLSDNMRVVSFDALDKVQVWKADSGVTLYSFTCDVALFLVAPDSIHVVSGKGDQRYNEILSNLFVHSCCKLTINYEHF